MRKPLSILLAGAGLAGAFAPQAALAQVPTVAGDADPAGQEMKLVTLDEIVVTAAKRSENLRDVAISVSALNYDNIEKRGLSGMGDYLVQLPAVTIQDRGPGRNQVSIRGIASTASGQADNSVGVYIGEIPLTAGLAFGAFGYPDMKLYDVNRVEVLRGPQGTLYGAGSMGGTIKMVPNDPLPGTFEAKADLTMSQTRHGGDNHELGAAFNIPVGDSGALRVSSYRHHQDGFIDNNHPGIDFATPLDFLGGLSLQDLGVADPGVPPRAKDNANAATTQGTRVSALFDLSERWQLIAAYLRQDSRADGLPEIDAGPAYTQSRFLAERLEDTFDLFDLRLTYRGEGFDVASTTGYMDRSIVQRRDVSSFFYTGPLQLTDRNTSENFSQELRLSSSGDSRWQWTAGVFYQRIEGNGQQNFEWMGNEASLSGFMDNVVFGFPTELTLDSDLYTRDDDATERQTAAFGQVSYDVTPRLRAKAGGRWFRYKQTSAGFEDGAFATGTPLGGTPTLRSAVNDENGFNPMAGLEFRPDSDTLHYVQASRGFRLGSTQAGVPAEAPGCAQELAGLGISVAQTREGVKADHLWSYEAGSKLRLADGRASLNGAVYYIDWEDIPVAYQLGCGFSFAANAGKATSKGIELEFVTALGDAFTLNLGGSYVDARLGQDMPAATGIAGRNGDRLPGVPRWNLQAGVQYGFLVGAHDGFVRMDYAYVGNFFNRFPGDAGYAESGDYGLVGLRAGISLTDRVSLELFAQNLTDEKVNLLVDTEIGDGRYVIGRPRTIGATLRMRY